MKKVFLQPILLLMLTLLSCSRGGQSTSHIKDLGDTPYQEDTILLTYGTNPERALVLLDSAVLMGNIDDYNGKIIRANIYSMSLDEQNQDSAIIICKSLLDHDSVTSNHHNRECVYNLLINVSRLRGDFDEYLHWAILKADLCRDNNKEVELLRTEAEIGMVMTHLGRIDEGLQKLDNSIRQLDVPGSIDRMDAFIIASKRKITVLHELNRYAESIPVAQNVLSRLSHYEQHAYEYAEDSYRLSWTDHPSDRDRYIDFCRAQADGFLAIAYSALGKDSEARIHLSVFEQSDYGHTYSARRMIIPAQMSLGLYDAAMQTCDKMIQSMGYDTTNVAYVNILNYKAIVARSKGQTDTAYELMKRHANLSKLLSDSLHRSEAHDYAARYHAKEQELKIQEAESERRVHNIVLASITVLLILTIIAIIYFVRQNKRISKKNHALVRMINEAKQLALKTDVADADDDGGTDEEAAKGDSAPEVIPFDMADFEAIDSVIRSEHLYQNPNLQRQDICRRFGISRIMLNNMLFQIRGNASVPQYINSIRMEEAVRLLRESPEDKSIASIAEKVGFSPANLRKHFITNFGMTPLEFRQNQ